MKIVPITFKQACEYVKKYHRHNKPPTGHKFSIGLTVNSEIVGVAMVGRPVARHFDDGWTAEINRTCTNGHENANSKLYGACRAACKAMGYLRVITYTQADETGASLKASGFVKVTQLKARKSWADSSGESYKHTRDPIGNGGVERILWEVRFKSTLIDPWAQIEAKC